MNSLGITQVTACPVPYWKMYFPEEEWHAGHRQGHKAEGWCRRLASVGYRNTIESLQITGPQCDKGVELPYQELLNVLGEDFARDFEEAPEQTISLVGLALRSMAGEDAGIGKVTARIIGFPNVSQFKDLKACNIGRFVSVRGTAVRVGPVRPLAYQMAFVCIKCQQPTVSALPGGVYRQPNRCSTYNCPGKVFLPDRNSPSTLCRNFQKIKIQELTDDDTADCGRIPRTLECELFDDLVNCVAPGENVIVSGILAVADSEETKAKATPTYALVMNVNSVSGSKSHNAQERIDEETQRVALFSVAEIASFRHIAQSPRVFKLLVDSLCPEIFGHEVVKAGLLLALFRGREQRGSEESFSVRANSHVLVVGDPGLGKSQMLAAVANVAPRSVFVGANTSTAAGLTATLHQEGGPGEYALEAGALVLADQGCCCIDEFDKIPEYKMLLDVMEQQVVNVAKAGVVCSLPARTSILAAANPIGGHYNHGKKLNQNIKLDEALLSRFDLIFVLLDKPDAEIDRYLSEQILAQISRNDRHKNKTAFSAAKSLATQVESELEHGDRAFLKELVDKSKQAHSLIPPALLRKYISYAQKYVHPRLSSEAAAALKEFYLDIRQARSSADDMFPVTTRQLESAIRLSEARAKAELRNTVTRQDAADVIAIMRYCMLEMFRKDGGQQATSSTAAKAGKPRSKSAVIKEFIDELMRISGRTGESVFEQDQLSQVFHAIYAQQPTAITFTELLEALNLHGYVLRKPGNKYQLLAV